MLAVTDLVVRYGPVEAVHGISFGVEAGEVVALIGPNGAGKTSTLNAVASVVRATSGTIVFDGRDITRSSPERVARRGLTTVPEGRRIFSTLTVRENLVVALAARRDRREGSARIEQLLDRFPILRTFKDRSAGVLSGGQQQLLAIARALVAAPRMLLLDEPSLGLAPVLVDELFALLDELRQEGVTILLVEQNAGRAIELADRTYVLRSGEIIRQGTRAQFEGVDLAELFLGHEVAT